MLQLLSSLVQRGDVRVTYVRTRNGSDGEINRNEAIFHHDLLYDTVE